MQKQSSKFQKIHPHHACKISIIAALSLLLVMSGNYSARLTLSLFFLRELFCRQRVFIRREFHYLAPRSPIVLQQLHYYVPNRLMYTNAFMLCSRFNWSGCTPTDWSCAQQVSLGEIKITFACHGSTELLRIIFSLFSTKLTTVALRNSSPKEFYIKRQSGLNEERRKKNLPQCLFV